MEMQQRSILAIASNAGDAMEEALKNPFLVPLKNNKSVVVMAKDKFDELQNLANSKNDEEK